MSYSYIKNVFPNFNSSKSLDDNVYNKLKSSNLTLVNDEIQSDLNFLPSSLNLEQYKNSHEIEHFTENQNVIANPMVTAAPSPISNNLSSNIDCEIYIKHVLSCSKCQGIIRKQLNTDNERLRNEELMELFSYILLGVFILLFIDNITK